MVGTTEIRKGNKLLLEELDELLGCVAEARALVKKMEDSADAFKAIDRRVKTHVTVINKLLH